MKLIVLDENQGGSESPSYWHVAEEVLSQIEAETVVAGPGDWPGLSVRDAVVVALGKKCAELAYGGKLGNYNEEVGNEYTAKDAEGVVAPLVLQMHPAQVLRLTGKKGGASEKGLTLWYDIWDTVQRHLLGVTAEPPDPVLLTDPGEIVRVLDWLVSNDLEGLAYDYETWGDRDARRPELNRTFRVLSCGVAFKQSGEYGALAFPLDRDLGDDARAAVAAAWTRVVDRGGTAHNAQYEHKCNLIRFGRTGPLRDTMLMDNALDELQKHSLERVMIRCGVPWAHYKRAHRETQVNPAEAPLPRLLRYNALDALGTLISDEVLSARLEAMSPDLPGVARGDELICRSLARLELAGMRADLSAAADYREKAKVELDGLRAEFRALPEVQRVERWATANIKSQKKGAVFNPKSPPMMKRLVLHELRVPVPAVPDGKGGRVIKLDKRALAPFIHQFPVLAKLNRERSQSSMVTGFLDKWELFIGPDGCIHSRYKQAEVVTGRLASSDPPQQNMPKGTEVRRAIISRFRGGRLVEGDAVQQEPRLVAGWSQDQRMIEAINAGLDLHGYVAHLIFNVEYEAKATKYREEFGKRMNLGIIYGQTEYGLSMKTGISIERAKELLQEYDELFPGIYEWRLSKHREAIETGRVTDLFGAMRHLPGAQSTDEWQVNRALRQAGNFPIQSTANRFTLFSLCMLCQLVDAEGLQEVVVPCGTVHDSLIADAAPGYERRAAEIMEYAFTFHNEQPYWCDRGVRMEAEVKTGPNLKDTDPYDLQRAA